MMIRVELRLVDQDAKTYDAVERTQINISKGGLGGTQGAYTSTKPAWTPHGEQVAEGQ